MTRVIHTGDTHLGYRQYHSPARREDFLDAFRQVVQDAVEDDVDAVVHAGDLYHDRRPGLRDLLGTIDVLEPLREHGIPFLAVVGNHEGTRDAQWLDLFETLGLAERLDADGRRVGNTVFYGMDYVPESRRPALEYEFAAPTDHHPDADHTTLVSHGLFTPFAHANWDLDVVLRESNVDFDAVLLGDNHTPDTVKVEDTWVTYCGSTERASADEREARGYNIVEFADEVTITRRGLDTRDFVFLDVDLGPGEGPEFIVERLREHDLEDAVVIVTIEGDGETVTPAAIEEFGREQGALVTRVNDRREIESPDADFDVSFADPDEAVEHRVREMGLSTAARTVDQTVRDSAVVDTNVRDRVRSHVEDALDDPGAFESVEPVEGEVESDAQADHVTGTTGQSGEDTSSTAQPDQDTASTAQAVQDAASSGDANDTETDAGREPDEPPEDDTPGEAVEADPAETPVEANEVESPVDAGEAEEATGEGVAAAEDDPDSGESGDGAGESSDAAGESGDGASESVGDASESDDESSDSTEESQEEDGEPKPTPGDGTNATMEDFL